MPLAGGATGATGLPEALAKAAERVADLAPGVRTLAALGGVSGFLAK
jgi:hypothetical protein